MKADIKIVGGAEAASEIPQALPAPAGLPDDQFLRLPDVIKMVGMGRSSIYSHVTSGKFPRPIYFNHRTTLWSKNGILRWMEDCKRLYALPASEASLSK